MMQLTVLIVALAMAPPAENPAAAESVRVPDGTAIHIRVREALSSQQLHNGDIVNFDVAEPVLIGDEVVIAKGARATARIASSKAAGHFGTQGRLGWSMEDVTAVDGTRVRLRFIKEPPSGGAGAKGMSKTQTAAVAAAASPLVLYYAPVIIVAIPFVAAQKGKPEIIPAGEHYLAFVDGEARVSTPKAPPEP